MSKFSAKQYALALFQSISESHPDDQDKILDNFINILQINNDLRLMDDIETEFIKFQREIKGIKVAEVTTARELGQQEEKQIIERLNKYTGGQVELKKKVDEGLVGGVIIRIGDELIDGSIKKHIQDLKNKLKK